MLYVDQPIGTGFSYGDDEATSTVTAAPFVWNLLQAFFEAFPTYESRDFGLWTESYGGHYGPEFAGKLGTPWILFPLIITYIYITGKMNNPDNEQLNLGTSLLTI